MKRRDFLKNTSAVICAAGLTDSLVKPSPLPQGKSPYNLYWGDMHCHSEISYGKGSLKDALTAAQEQRLDFCAVVGHSSWHDTPRDEEHMNRIEGYIVYHDEGYERLARMWPDIKIQTKKVLKPGKFIPFLAFEWHSTRYGDHNVYYFEPEGEIVLADSISELRAKMKDKKALIVPHHTAYVPGSRGIDWDHFKTSDQSPMAEVYSFHGCSISDLGPYPNLREMGPRSSEGTTETGLQKGHKFGFIGSTDNHYGYPGSFGEGKVGCFAKELTQEALWEAFIARRVYAVTGDRIMVNFALNNAFMGENIESAGDRMIDIQLEAENFIDYVDLIKNGRIIKRFSPLNHNSMKVNGTIRAKVRFEWGWGRIGELTEWNGVLKLTDGRILDIHPCFHAQPTKAEEDPLQPNEAGVRAGHDTRDENLSAPTLISRLTEQNQTGCSFHSYSTGNPTPLTPLNNSFVLDVEMPLNAAIEAKVNGKMYRHTLAELLEGQRSHLIGGYLDAALSFHRAVPEKAFIQSVQHRDNKPEKSTDYYYVCVRQVNHQWAWTTPIWVKT